MDLLFSFSGRISRSRWWLGQFCVLTIMIIGFFIITFAATSLGETSEMIATVGLSFVSVWMSLAIGIKRYHDRDKSGLWMLIALIPFIGGAWQFVELGALEGTSDDNSYGPPPGSEPNGSNHSSFGRSETSRINMDNVDDAIAKLRAQKEKADVQVSWDQPSQKKPAQTGHSQFNQKSQLFNNAGTTPGASSASKATFGQKVG